MIYLYVKTHRKTGLKYLGKTEQDPFKYNGSGKYWNDHLRIHGNEVDTEILRECQSNDEIREWGLYYSKLWNIVDVRNEQGKKTWANMKPEEGDGHSSETAIKMWENQELRDLKSKSTTGKSNPRYDSTIYSFVHISGDKIESTMYEFKKLNPKVPTNKVSLLVSGKRKSVAGWRLATTLIEDTGRTLATKKITDLNEYTFINHNGQTVTCTRKNFINLSGISRSCVNEIVLHQKTYKGWRLK